ncbi:MAG TPA: anthrone oxygenase family protein [Trebonia sp.]|nr:anthrone oxygenase family protein [Trebonia sp.]
MTNTTLRAVTLLAATLTMGLSAGTFALYAHTIMPGLRTADNRTFVSAFQHLDRAIVNPWFMITAFLGALVFTAAAAFAAHGTAAFGWVVAALVLYLVAVVITVGVEVPANDAMKAAGDVSHVDAALVRQRFDESRWAAWNVVRVIATVPAFGLLAWALVLFGRATA